jgi:very-short-patch-repair endonuclease
MICLTCRNDLREESFNALVYHQCRVNGNLGNCLECSQMTKSARKMHLKQVLAQLRPINSQPRITQKSEKRAAKDRAWSKLTIHEKRQSLTDTRTYWEKRLDDELRKRNIPFDIQVPVGPYFADFQILPGKVAVEIDGSSHDTAERKQKDIKRDKQFRNMRWKVLRFRNEEVHKDIDGIIRRIQEVCEIRDSRRIVVIPPKKKQNPVEWFASLPAE